jgi:hypothetical protein
MTENTKKKFRFTGSHSATAAMFLIVVFLWRDVSRTKSTQRALAEQNQELASRNQAMADKLAEANKELVEEPETLLLQPPTVTANSDGTLTARFRFEPIEGVELPEQLTVVVRAPGAQIIAFKPVAEPAFSSIVCVVNAKGNLGMIEGSPADLSGLEFELTVSEPVTATVRGSDGIRDFELDITPAGCTVRKL